MVLGGCRISGLVKSIKEHEENRGKCGNTYWVFGSFSIYLDIYYLGTYSVQRHIHIKYIGLKKNMKNLKKIGQVLKQKYQNLPKKKKSRWTEKNDNIGNNRKRCWIIACKISNLLKWLYKWQQLNI